MLEQLSLKWNIIKSDEETLYQDIEDILKRRFEDDFNFEKTLDDLHNPYELKGMKEAVERIKKAKENGEKVMIFGDYDVDWVTSTSILMHFFKKVWIQASYRLPHRIKDGYGMKPYFIDEFTSIWIDLIVTVDCWSRDLEVVKKAKENWIDIIITDHHTTPIVSENDDNILDYTVALINPKRPDCDYPFKFLAWAWVAFKLMSALAYEFMSKDDAEKYIKESIDIAAIWTVADCMSLTGENRIIVEVWLKQIKNSRSRGIKKLLEQKIHEDLDSDIFGFLIWPRINAAWRLDTPYKAVNLILNNSDSVYDTLDEIEILNDRRRKLTHKFFDDALEKINPKDNIIFYHSTEITHWIIWIVAWRLTEKYYRPSIVLIEEEEKLIASCRSPEYFSIVEILEKYKEYFVAFGWHKQAAGFTILKEKFEEFKNKVLNEVNWIDFAKHKKTIKVDKVVELNDLWFRFLDKINKFKPFWLGNPKPVLMIKNLDYTKIAYLGQWMEHIKMDVKNGFKIVAFGMGEFMDQIKKSEKISIVFELNLDTFNWSKNIQLNIIDIINN